MIGKILLLSLRKLSKNRLYSLFVVIGLSLGVISLISTIQWTAWHLGYDRSFAGHEEVYRLTFEENQEDFYRHTARILHGHALNRIVNTEQIPGIRKIARLTPFRKAAILTADDSFYEPYAYSCDPEFLELFPTELISGNLVDLLKEPFTMVLTRSAAEKYFGDEDPVGKSIRLIHQFEVEGDLYEIRAVVEDYPENSHFRISALTSLNDPENYRGTAWTYLQLEKEVDTEGLCREIKDFLIEDQSATYVEEIEPRLQSLADIHLHSHKGREITTNMKVRSVWIIGISGLMIFFLAWFNFSLLSFSQNKLREHQLIIQWQNGASGRDFFLQFLIENLVLSILTFIVGAISIILLAPLVEEISSVPIFENRRVLALVLLSVILLMFLTSALLAAQSKHTLNKAIGVYTDQSNRMIGYLPGRRIFNRLMIGLEFIITFVLISNLMMIRLQTNFGIEKQMGADQPEMIHIPNLHREIINKYHIFHDKMLESAHIAGMTASMEEPTGQTLDANTFNIDGVESGEQQLFLYPVDADFIKIYRLNILYGRDVSGYSAPEDSMDHYLLNETAARMINPEDPGSLVNSKLTLDFPHEGLIFPGPIVGIVEDFHLSGVDFTISPMVIFPKNNWLFCFSVVPAKDPEPALAHLNNVWEELFPDYPLEYYFGEQLSEKLYKDELQQSDLLLLFSLLSLIVSGLGLFALSGLVMHKRVKAAVIRKINGARFAQLVFQELAYYLWLGVLASAVAVPVSYYLMVRWMLNYSYRIDIPIWIFMLSAAVLILFSCLSVFYHALRIARLNPVRFLKEG